MTNYDWGDVVLIEFPQSGLDHWIKGKGALLSSCWT